MKRFWIILLIGCTGAKQSGRAVSSVGTLSVSYNTATLTRIVNDQATLITGMRDTMLAMQKAQALIDTTANGIFQIDSLGVFRLKDSVTFRGKFYFKGEAHFMHADDWVSPMDTTYLPPTDTTTIPPTDTTQGPVIDTAQGPVIDSNNIPLIRSWIEPRQIH